MPRPSTDDPLLCPASNNADLVKDWEMRIAHREAWWICPACKRVMKVCAAPHRVRSRNTRSLDQTRDILADMTREEIESATATEESLLARSAR